VPWLSLGAYAIATCVLVAFGRRGLALEQALTSRYSSYSLHLALALLVLAMHAIPSRPHRRRLVPALALAACLLFLWPYPHQIALMRNFRAFILEMKAGMLFMRWVPFEPEIRRIGPEDIVREHYEHLDARGFLRPPMLASPRLESIQLDCDPACDHGTLESLEVEPDGTLVVEGQARLPERGEAAHVVALAWSGETGDSTAFALARMHASGAYPDGSPSWLKRIAPSRIPPGARRLSAWAFDAISGKVHHLGGDQDLSVSR
jgi:hypothetical protein